MGDLVSAGLSIGGALLQSGGAEDAAGAQVAASQEAIEAVNKIIREEAIPELRQAIQQGRTDITGGLTGAEFLAAPYNISGLSALDALQRSMGLAPPGIPGGS